jgi:hypothetical protein
MVRKSPEIAEIRDFCEINMGPSLKTDKIPCFWADFARCNAGF